VLLGVVLPFVYNRRPHLHLIKKFLRFALLPRPLRRARKSLLVSGVGSGALINGTGKLR
jgi:hypothetical protein